MVIAWEGLLVTNQERMDRFHEVMDRVQEKTDHLHERGDRLHERTDRPKFTPTTTARKWDNRGRQRERSFPP